MERGRSRWWWLVAAAAVVVAASVVVGLRSASAPGRGVTPDDPVSARFVPRGDVDVRFGQPAVAAGGLVAHPLSLDRHWFVGGDWGVWAAGPAAGLEVALQSPGPRRLVLEWRARASAAGAPGQRAEIVVNGAVVGREELGSGWRTTEVRIAGEQLAVGVNRVELRFESYRSPREDGISDDPRPLAAGIRRIALLREGGGGLFGLGGRRAPAEVGAGGAVTVRESGELVMPLEIPESARSAGFRVRLADGADDDAAARISPAVLLADGRRVPADPFRLGAANPAGEGRLDLTEAGAGLVVASFDVDLSDGAELLVEPIEVTAEPAAARVPPRPPAVGPDVVVVILDAARAGHLGCYGYPRRTTPNIDRLASESTVFRRAFALAPYTLCSVPTMITGESFLRHGVTRHEHALDPSATTLAERLQEAGWRTACFSATPNNSRARGFDQGFDEFYELWRIVRPGRSIDPGVLARRATAWIEAADPEQPFFLQLHFVPPHEPYDPGPRFDRFSDPGYDGPVDGSLEVNQAFNRGELALGDSDLRHLVDLYDGNLLRADHALGGVFTALRDRPRWRDTVVLVTSDHGEELGEHGLIGHNTHVYDEMLWVPFILRLPPSAGSPPAVDDRLVTLADIVPTLAAAAGVQAPDLVEGHNLLDPSAAGANRFFVARNDRRAPVFGVRTAAWKAVLLPTGSGELFDLAADPSERDDLALSRHGMYAALQSAARQRIAAIEASAVAAPEAALTAEDEAMLRELGYLQ